MRLLVNQRLVSLFVLLLTDDSEITSHISLRATLKHSSILDVLYLPETETKMIPGRVTSTVQKLKAALLWEEISGPRYSFLLSKGKTNQSYPSNSS